MKKKNFKLGMFILTGLAGCFLALSAMLVASAGISGGSDSGAPAGGTPHLRKERPANQAADFQFHGKSPGNKSGVRVAGPGGSEADPCRSSATACSGILNQGEDGLANRNGETAGNSVDASSKSSSPGDRNAFYPSSYGFNFSGAGGAASGQFADTGETGGSSQSGGVTGTLPSIAGPDPETISFPNDPIATPPPLSLFFPTVPPGPGDPAGPIDNTPSDPPSTGATATYSVPEPSTFWLLIASLTALVLAHGHVRRARPASRIRSRPISTKSQSFSPAANPLS